LFVLCLASNVVALPPVPSVHAEDLPPSTLVEGIVGYAQERNLSCESRSATDLGSYWGAGFTEDEFLRRLPKSDNPQRGFVGDVDMPAGSMPPLGYGVYVEPVAATLRSFGLDAEAWLSLEMDTLKGELATQRPVIVWATYDMQQPGVETWVSWDGVPSTVVRWQHTFITVGYDEGGVYLVDAYDGGTKYFSYEAFVPAWDQLGRMAVTVAGVLAKPSERTWLATEIEGRIQFLVDGRWKVVPE
jgi:uncharacterized protein YvpB